MSVSIKEIEAGNFLAVQWLGLSIFTARAQVSSLVTRLRSHKLISAVRKIKTLALKKNAVIGKKNKEIKSIITFQNRKFQAQMVC